VDGKEDFQKRFEKVEIEGVGAVGFGAGRVVVDFDEETVDACGDGGAGQQGNELGLAAADTVGRRRLLNRVCGVEDDRRKVTHDGERTEIDDKVVVAEARAALGKEDPLVSGGTDFLDAVAHIPGGNELALLDVDGAAGAAGSDQQVSLAAEESRDLENVGGFSGDLAVGRLVNVGEDGQAAIFGDSGEDPRAFDETGAAKALDAGAVGLVVTGFEDEGDVKIGRDALKSFGHGAHMGLRLDDARAGNKKEPASTHMDGTNLEGCTHDTNSIVLMRDFIGPWLIGKPRWPPILNAKCRVQDGAPKGY